MGIYTSDIKIVGFEELMKYVKDLPDKGGTHVLAAVEKSAELVKHRMIQRLYSNNSVISGDLARAIDIKQVRVRAAKYSRTFINQPIYTIGPRHAKFGKRKVEKGERDYSNYGHLVELGHALRFEKGGKVIKMVKEKPFMRPAAEESKEEIINYIAEGMNTALADKMDRK